MASKYDDWKKVALDKGLTHYFTPTVNRTKEISKAYFKNKNLPFLQYMYHGDEQETLHCTISGTPGFITTIDYAEGGTKQRFNIDFNHVRQRMSEGRQDGVSVDKSESPSGIIRRLYLNKRPVFAAEFLTIMPINPLVHSHITQDSAKSNITLSSFPKETWIWALQTPENFKSILSAMGLENDALDYDWFIDHMTDINYDSIWSRIQG